MKLPSLLLLGLAVSTKSFTAPAFTQGLQKAGLPNDSISSSKLPASSTPTEAFCDVCEVAERQVENSMKETTEAMLFESEFIYAIATLRKEGDKETEDNFLNLNRYELIRTDRGAQEPNYNQARRLKYPLTMDAIKSFVDSNKEWVTSISDINTDPNSNYNIEKMLSMAVRDNMEIIELDDIKKGYGAVFGIVLNRTRKRVSVIFRGSSSAFDWAADLQLFSVPVAAPEKVKLMSEQVGIHKGFSSYLGLAETVEYDATCQRIIRILEEVYAQEEYSDYQLHVSGHSLGGALSQVFAFELAGSGRFDKYPMAYPVTCLSFASPPVGDETYSEAFQRLETLGWLRHFRFSNQGDPVPVTLPQLKQSGLNLHFKKNTEETEICYCADHNFLNQYLNINILDPIYFHMVETYMEKLDERKEYLFSDGITPEKYWESQVKSQA